MSDDGGAESTDDDLDGAGDEALLVPYVLPYHREQVDRDIIRELVLRHARGMDILPLHARPATSAPPSALSAAKLTPAELNAAKRRRKELDFVPRRVLDVGCGISAAWISELGPDLAGRRV
jgi:hypothetical protein